MTAASQADGPGRRDGPVVVACPSRRHTPIAWLMQVGVQRGTRAPDRPSHPPSWLTCRRLRSVPLPCQMQGFSHGQRGCLAVEFSAACSGIKAPGQCPCLPRSVVTTGGDVFQVPCPHPANRPGASWALTPRHCFQIPHERHCQVQQLGHHRATCGRWCPAGGAASDICEGPWSYHASREPVRKHASPAGTPVTGSDAP